MLIKTLTARAPAKLIISGEHAVLYGQPALAMAVDRYITTTTSWYSSAHVHFKLLDLSYAKTYTYMALRRLAKKLQADYKNSALKRPFELLQYAVSSLLDYLHVVLPKGIEITVASTIPIGCGMGSSAAAVISTLYSITNFLQFNLTQAEYLTFSRQIENLQHGKSSGLDLHLVTHGGCLRFHNGSTLPIRMPQMPMYIVNTGKPLSTTGDCVAKASEVFASNPGLAEEFGVVTNAIDKAIAETDLYSFNLGIKANHALLSKIGVVPERVANFIQEIENSGAVAKISGAGAVIGENAGITLVFAPEDVKNNIIKIVQRYGYKLEDIQVDTHGITIL